MYKTNNTGDGKRPRSLLYAAVCMSLAAGCAGQEEEKFRPHPFPLPEIPSVVSSDADAAEYLVLNYWDEFTDTAELYPCDSGTVNGVAGEEVEQALVNWLALVRRSDSGLAGKCIGRMFDRISACEAKDTASTVFETISSMVGKYLYDPNSPLRNEDLYLQFALRMAGYEDFTPEKRAVYEYEARMCSLNRTGTAAADFRFIGSDGTARTLYGIRADYTLLFFSNPGCEACKYIVDRLESDPDLSGLVSSGTVAVVNIYIDEDIGSWYSYQGAYPDEWYNGYDPDYVIRTDVLYNVRAIPSLYLLDRDKKVILKDAPEDEVFSYLHSLC